VSSEIPFQKKPPSGFYEVDWNEETPTKPSFNAVRLDSMDNKRKRDDEEETAVKDDAKKQKVTEKKNLPGAIMQINKLNDPENVRTRSKLMLPSPQLTESELEELAKLENTPETLLVCICKENFLMIFPVGGWGRRKNSHQGPATQLRQCDTNTCSI
jgi:pre-mRNA-splicing factor CDC5/CEF1